MVRLTEQELIKQATERQLKMAEHCKDKAELETDEYYVYAFDRRARDYRQRAVALQAVIEAQNGDSSRLMLLAGL